MNIKNALLSETGIRLSNSNGRWLVMDEVYVSGGEFVVYESKPYARKTIEIYRGDREEDAVQALLGDRDEN